MHFILYKKCEYSKRKNGPLNSFTYIYQNVKTITVDIRRLKKIKKTLHFFVSFEFNILSI
jgi:hypothetical protein